MNQQNAYKKREELFLSYTPNYQKLKNIEDSQIQLLVELEKETK